MRGHAAIVGPSGSLRDQWRPRLRGRADGGTLGRGGQSVRARRGSVQIAQQGDQPRAGPAHQDTLPAATDGRSTPSHAVIAASGKAAASGMRGARLARENARIDNRYSASAPPWARARPPSPVYAPRRTGFPTFSREGRDSSRKVGARTAGKIRGRRRAVLAQLAVDKIDARRGDRARDASGRSPGTGTHGARSQRLSESGTTLAPHGGRLG